MPQREPSLDHQKKTNSVSMKKLLSVGSAALYPWVLHEQGCLVSPSSGGTALGL